MNIRDRLNSMCTQSGIIIVDYNSNHIFHSHNPTDIPNYNDYSTLFNNLYKVPQEIIRDLINSSIDKISIVINDESVNIYRAVQITYHSPL